VPLHFQRALQALLVTSAAFSMSAPWLALVQGTWRHWIVGLYYWRGFVPWVPWYLSS
jgi:hypothetical protein